MDIKSHTSSYICLVKQAANRSFVECAHNSFDLVHLVLYRINHFEEVGSLFRHVGLGFQTLLWSSFFRICTNVVRSSVVQNHCGLSWLVSCLLLQPQTFASAGGPWQPSEVPTPVSNPCSCPCPFGVLARVLFLSDSHASTAPNI